MCNTQAQDTAELFFEDMRVPKSSLLGEENKGFVYLMTELPQVRLFCERGVCTLTLLMAISSMGCRSAS